MRCSATGRTCELAARFFFWSLLLWRDMVDIHLEPGTSKLLNGRMFQLDDGSSTLYIGNGWLEITISIHWSQVKLGDAKLLRKKMRSRLESLDVLFNRKQPIIGCWISGLTRLVRNRGPRLLIFFWHWWFAVTLQIDQTVHFCKQKFKHFWTKTWKT